MVIELPINQKLHYEDAISVLENNDNLKKTSSQYLEFFAPFQLMENYLDLDFSVTNWSSLMLSAKLEFYCITKLFPPFSITMCY